MLLVDQNKGGNDEWIKEQRNDILKSKKIRKNLKKKLKEKKEELETLRFEEEEIAGQEILSICKDNGISLIDAIDVFSNNEKEEKKEARAFENENKESRIYGN